MAAPRLHQPGAMPDGVREIFHGHCSGGGRRHPAGGVRAARVDRRGRPENTWPGSRNRLRDSEVENHIFEGNVENVGRNFVEARET